MPGRAVLVEWSYAVVARPICRPAELCFPRPIDRLVRTGVMDEISFCRCSVS